MVNNINNKITMGQGEYVVFHQQTGEEKKELSRETYEKAYKVLQEFAPAAIVNSEADKKISDEKCAHRYELIKQNIKKIDPSLEVAFIPKTLYELFFIKKCIKEDLKQKYICPLVNKNYHDSTIGPELYELYKKMKENILLKDKCWHCCFFDDAGNNEDRGLKNLAYRLNRTIVKNLSPTPEGFSQKEFLDFTESKIEFLKKHHNNCTICSCSYPGPTTNFGFESNRGDIKSMGINTDADAEIIRNAMKLDCSREALNSFVLYRGSNFQKDSVACTDSHTPYSLSFGTGLFAGCIFDGGATAFHYMRKEKNAYAVFVPHTQLNDSPFYIPPTNTLCQLFGYGESFHGRTKSWKFNLLKNIAGINTGGGKDPRPLLRSNLSKTQLISQFEQYKKKATHLK